MKTFARVVPDVAAPSDGLKTRVEGYTLQIRGRAFKPPMGLADRRWRRAPRPAFGGAEDVPTNRFRIHHVSDVHFGPSHYRPTAQQPVPMEKARNAEAYIAHLTALRKEEYPDLIVVSGDLMTSAQETEMVESAKFISRIVNVSAMKSAGRAPSPLPRVMMVPGNHDVDWGMTTAAEKHNRYRTLSDMVGNNGRVASSQYLITEAPCFYDFGDDTNLFIYLLNSTSLGGIEDPRLRALYDELKQSATGLSADKLAAFQRIMRKDPGYVEKSEIDAMRLAASNVPAGRIKIAVVHHHPNHVPSEDMDAFDTILNAGILKSALLEAGFDIVLHGHRHVFHCSAELRPTPGDLRRCYFISADSLGCSIDAPFVEIDLLNPGSVAPEAPSPRMVVREHRYVAPNGYRPEPVACDEPLKSKPAQSAPQPPQEEESLLSLIERQNGAINPAEKPALLNAVHTLLPKLQLIQSKLTDWSDDSDWIRQFHFQIDSYKQIHATALYERPASENPNYHRYLREQFDERLKRLKARDEKVLYFSPDVLSAIARTGWRPDQTMWDGYKIEAGKDPDQYALELARVVICDINSVNPSVLRNMDHDHRIFAIPLFFIASKDVDPDQAVDFAIGRNREGNPIKVCAYDKTKSRVEEQSPLRAWELMGTFENLLRNKKLRTAERFLGSQPMNVNPAQGPAQAQAYSVLRKASQLIVNTINRTVPSGAKRGLDLCCGTGNYTVPFADRLEALYGLDIDKDMLRFAQQRSAKIQWVEADAKDTGLDSSSFDAIWMISALHYFKDAEQDLLFKEILRLLQPGGVFLADTEFLEQHGSLWLVHYFPSLRARYSGGLFTQAQYQTMFRKAGFASVEFATSDYLPTEGDAFLRIGQHKPELYLDPATQKAIPALRDMPANERIPGLRRLKEDIDSGEIQRVVEKCRKVATLPGDLGFIIATK